jgi:hypothetical protein
MLNLKHKHIGLLLFFFVISYFFACAHQKPVDPTDKDLEVWQLKLSGQTEGELEMLMKLVEVGGGMYSIIGKISGAINDHRGGSGEANFKFKGKIENNVFSAHLSGHSEMREGPSIIVGEMRGTFEILQGAGNWTVSHALGISTGKYVMVKLR